MLTKDVVMMAADFTDHLTQRPEAPLIIEHVGQMLAAERRQRERFYEEVREDQKAEFINGEMIVHSPVRKRHATVSGNPFALLRTHCSRRSLGYVGHEKLRVRLTRNDHEPDICFFHAHRAERFTEDQSLFPAPDLVV
ncbi:MAG: Uma2 family endonuclease [Catalinimonas sp.]